MTLPWTTVVTLTLGLLTAGVIAGIPIGTWLATLPVPDRRLLTPTERAQLLESLRDMLGELDRSSPPTRPLLPVPHPHVDPHVPGVEAARRAEPGQQAVSDSVRDVRRRRRFVRGLQDPGPPPG